MEIFGIPLAAFLGQLLLGLVNGSFYAMLSLGLAVIFGLLNVINFAHGALYMMGAVFAWMGLTYFGLNYWVMLAVAPLLVGVFGVIIERLLLRHLYKLDHLYGLLLTFGLVLLIEGFFRSFYGVSGLPYTVPEQLEGATNLGFMIMPNYRAWVVVASLIVCFGTWFVIERTKSREHGDYASNVALLLSKGAGRKPRELAEAIAKTVPKSQHIEAIEVAGPGFINFRLNQACRIGTLRRVLEQGERYGCQPEDSRESVTVEFVSANPNGPLHVGHGRGAAYEARSARQSPGRRRRRHRRAAPS
jgi:hypothetical protein